MHAHARSVPGVCNAYLPEDTTLNRFMWVVNYFAQQGFYIILDNQFNLDQTATQNTQLWLYRVSWAPVPRRLSLALLQADAYPFAPARFMCNVFDKSTSACWHSSLGEPIRLVVR